MVQIRTLSRPRSGLLGQLGLSVTATVAATLIVSGLQREWGSLRPIQPTPQLTSGGKFAARVEALRAAADDTDDAVPPPPRVPLLVADSALQALPIDLTHGNDASPPKAAVEMPKAARRSAHAEGHHRAVADSVDVLPPRRSDNVVLAAATMPAPAETSTAQGLWTTTKGFYRQAVWLGGDVIDRVNPLNLLP